MIQRLVGWSTRHHRIVIAGALLLGIGGAWARRALSRDVLPDLSSPQIVLVVDWMGHPATEVASAVTSVLTGALEGTPGATAIRGSSMAGMSYVDVVFAASRDLAPGRRAITERVDAVRPRLPATARVQIGPEASATSWVYQYVLVDPSHGQPPYSLRRLQDRLVRPALASIPGVAEIASVAGGVQDALVELLADKLLAHGLAYSDALVALRPVLAARPATSLSELQDLPIPSPAPGGAAVRLGDVARVRLADGMPNALADLGGVWPAAGGIVIARPDADLPSLIARVESALEGARARLPQGVRLVTVHTRLDLATRVEHTLFRALAEEIAVVVLVILIFLLHGRSALVPLVTLPAVLLLTFAGMAIAGIPATIMSLAGIGIALGVAVDADLVALEACHRRLEALGPDPSAADRRAAILAAAGAFAPAILISLLITAVSFLPVFAFTGETGRLVRPLVLAKTLVVGAAALVTLTLAPALRDRLLRGRVRPEFDNPLTRVLVRAYRPFVRFALARPALTLVTAGLAVVSCLPILHRLGGEFLPRIDEGDLLYMPTTLPGVDGHDADYELRRQDHALAAFKEVSTVFGKIGRADTATDPAPFSMIETTIRLLPRSEWPLLPRRRWYSAWAPPFLRRALGLVWPEETPSTTAELVERLDHAARLPGWSRAWTAPIRARMDMMATGVRTPVGVRIVSSDPARLDALGAAVRARVEQLPGTRSATFESLGGETRLELALDPAALARYGVDPALARATAALLLTGGQLGEIDLEGNPQPRLEPRLRVIVNPERNLRGPADQLRAMTVRATAPGSSGQPVPLALLGHARFVTRPAALRTERGEAVAYVYVDLTDGTDIEGYVQRAEREIARQVSAGKLALGPGERIEWTGQHALLAAGQRRLWWIVPGVALTMLLLLLLQFRSLTEALIVLVSVPFALVGSFWTLFLLDYRMSAPVWVGLLSVVGLAMQTGVVMVVYIDAAFHRRLREGRLHTREDIVAAHAEGTVQRLRPKIMTISTMLAGLLPLAFAEGAGAEIARRVAAPMMGGLLTSAFLTLEVLPVLYTIWRHRQLKKAQRTGIPIASIVGQAPPWARIQ